MKPCPFCGSDETSVSTNRIEYWVVCDNCLATGPTDPDDYDAKTRWNTRAAQQPLIDGWACPHCYSEVPGGHNPGCQFLEFFNT